MNKDKEKLENTVNTKRYEAVKELLKDIFPNSSPECLLSSFEKDNGSLNPYHNLQHCYSVMLTAKFIIDREEDIRRKFTKKEIDSLLIAAMFHDVQHTGFPDTVRPENIDRAMESFYNFLENHIEDSRDITITPLLVESLIESTRYPHRDFDISEDKKELYFIIRDSDLVASHSFKDKHIFLQGLERETGNKSDDKFPDSKLLFSETAIAIKNGSFEAIF